MEVELEKESYTPRLSDEGRRRTSFLQGHSSYFDCRGPFLFLVKAGNKQIPGRVTPHEL